MKRQVPTDTPGSVSPRHAMQMTAPLSHSGSILSFILGLFVVFASPAWAAGSFSHFAGTWKGGGTVTTVDGNQEKIRCLARYGVNTTGDRLDINVNCASDSYRVNLVSTVLDQGGTLSGSWQETTRQIQGDVNGSLPSPDTLQASLQALGGGLELAARTTGKHQAITITIQGSDITGATIKLRKS